VKVTVEQIWNDDETFKLVCICLNSLYLITWFVRDIIWSNYLLDPQARRCGRSPKVWLDPPSCYDINKAGPHWSFILKKVRKYFWIYPNEVIPANNCPGSLGTAQKQLKIVCIESKWIKFVFGREAGPFSFMGECSVVWWIARWGQDWRLNGPSGDVRDTPF
jgi:hypothetical protein